MFDEIEDKWDNTPWIVKIILIAFGLYYIREREGVFWTVLQVIVIAIALPSLFVFFFVCYWIARCIVYLQEHAEIAECIGWIVIFSVIVAIELATIVNLYKKKRKKVRMGSKERKHGKKVKMFLFVFPILFGFVGALPFCFLLRNKEMAQDLLKVGMLQNFIVVLVIFLAVLLLL